MAGYLLDTNIASFIVRRSSLTLLHRVRTLPAGSFAISVVTEAEIRLGLALAPPEAKFRQIAEMYLQAVDIRPWDSRCAEHYALLASRQQRLGRPLAPMDTMIAAHALAHDFVLVSNDAAFRQVEGLRLEDWTQGPQSA